MERLSLFGVGETILLCNIYDIYFTLYTLHYGHVVEDITDDNLWINYCTFVASW